MSEQQKAAVERITEALAAVPDKHQEAVADALVHDIGVLAKGIAFGQAKS